MDWKTLFLNANGRIGQKDFWIGFAILFVAGMILGMIPGLGQIVAIVLIYPWVCVYAKRLHDSGRSGWLILIPLVVGMVLAVVAGAVGGASMIAASTQGSDAAMTAGMLGGFGMIGMSMLLILIVWIGFALWVGLAKGDPGDNKYGPPPRDLVGGSAPTTPAA